MKYVITSFPLLDGVVLFVRITAYNFKLSLKHDLWGHVTFDLQILIVNTFADSASRRHCVYK